MMTSRFVERVLCWSAALAMLAAAGGSRARAQNLTPAEDEIRDKLIAEAQKAHDNHDHAQAKTLAQKALAMRATPSLQKLAAREASETGDFAFAYLTAEKCLLEADRDANLPDKDRI